MPKSTELMAEETKDIRKQLHYLIKGGLTESEALGQVLPKDKNRRRKLDRWKDRGIFPLPAEELAEYGELPSEQPPSETGTAASEVIDELGFTEEHTGDSTKPPTSEPTSVTVEQEPEAVSAESPNEAAHIPVIPNGHTGHTTLNGLSQETIFGLIEQQVNRAVQSRFNELVSDLEVADKPSAVGGRGNRGRTHDKVTVSIPSDLHDALEALGGVKSQHVTHAIALYLKLVSGHTSIT